MNELSNKVISKVTGIRNFFKSSVNGTIEVSPLDVKLFYVFENTESDKNKFAKRKRTHSDNSRALSSGGEI
jgi:hypothetical protein